MGPTCSTKIRNVLNYSYVHSNMEICTIYLWRYPLIGTTPTRFHVVRTTDSASGGEATASTGVIIGAAVGSVVLCLCMTAAIIVCRI